MAIVALCGLVFVSACSERHTRLADELNEKAYAYHYRHLDSTMNYAQRAFSAASTDESRAEALNHIAFVHLMRMDYATADSLLTLIPQLTDSPIECLVSDIQMMRLCQRESHNKEFYDHREKADRHLQQLSAKRNRLSQHQQRRLLYAQTEYAIVSSTYYYYVGLHDLSASSLLSLNQLLELQQDTAQYLNYLYNVGAGGILKANTTEELRQQETDYLVRCLFLAQKSRHTYFTANALQALADHLSDSRRDPSDPNLQLLVLLINRACPGIITNWNQATVDSLPVVIAHQALSLFQTYGDPYQVAGAYRSVASCQMSQGHYQEALQSLGHAIASPLIQQAPDLVASIQEQLSVAYSAVNDKPSSDRCRNSYLDIQEQTRQDRYLESRAERLNQTNFSLNIVLTIVVAVFLLLLFLLGYYYRISKRQRSQHSLQILLQPLEQWRRNSARQRETLQEHLEELNEEQMMAMQRREEGQRTLLEGRAKLSLVTSVIPLIDRMRHEVDRLQSTPSETDEARREYIAELASQVNTTNQVLTDWIQMKQGHLMLHIESFHLQPLFDLVRKAEPGFAHKHISLQLTPTDAIVKADRALTLFMLNTLTDNARKFTAPGGTTLIQATQTDDYVELSVTNGPIAEEPQEKGFGFGLKNCRGIIEKYRKTSRLFRVCSFDSQDEPDGRKTHRFRLPAVRQGGTIIQLLITLTLTTFCSLKAAGMEEELTAAKHWADSAYFANIDGQYEQVISFADSCLHHLNRHHQHHYPLHPEQMRLHADGSPTAAELIWFRRNDHTDYHTILDIRNETAVAALALHRWDLYNYNNSLYTQLFKEMSADASLPEYCRTMQQSQSQKIIILIVLISLLVVIVVAYYLFFYRRQLRYRHCLRQIGAINEVLQTEGTPEEKLQKVRQRSKGHFPGELQTVVHSVCKALEEEAAALRMQSETMEQKQEQLHATRQEVEMLHVGNAVLDNCLSALKHETMYYPSRILSLPANAVTDLQQTVHYYRELYSLLSLQAVKSVDAHRFPMTPLADCQLLAHATLTDCPDASFVPHLLGNRTLLDEFYELLRQQGGVSLSVSVSPYQQQYLQFVFRSPAFQSLSTDVFINPRSSQLPFFLCRQIVREHSEATHLRSCGIRLNAIKEIVTILPSARR